MTNQAKQITLSDAFTLDRVSVLDFSFKTYPAWLDHGEKQLKLNVSIASEAIKTVDGYAVRTLVDINTTDDSTPKMGFESFAELLTQIKTTPNFDESYLSNAVAISYSYLRPLIAQMTVLAKLPPLDLDPVDFRQLDVEVKNV